MAVTYRSTSKVVGTGTSPTPSEPAGAASGDALIAVFAVDKGFSAALPSGWTELYSVSTTSSFDVKVGYIIRGGSAPSYAFTHTGSHYREVFVLCLQPGSGSVALDSQSSAGATGSAASHNPNPPATTAVASASLAVCGGIFWGGGDAWAAPSGYTLRGAPSGGDDVCLASRSLSASGSEDPGAFSGTHTSGGTPDYWEGFTVTFTDGAGGGAAFDQFTSMTLTGVGS